jgi:uncharacterized membrane protein
VSRSLSDLHALSDDQLIAEHDERAQHTVIGTSYYVEELSRRAQERDAKAMRELAEASHRLSVRTFWLTVASAALSVLAVIAAFAALLLGR